MLAPLLFVLLADPVPTIPASRGLDYVAQHTRLEVEHRRSSNLTARYVYGGIAVELEADGPSRDSRKDMQAYIDELPAGMRVDVVPVEGGVRAVVWAPGRRLRAALSPRGSKTTVRLGVESEDSRLRRLATVIARPLPRPRELGAALELWEDAERATQAAKLKLARRLWNKLADEPALADLASVRIAELYIMSGHLNEAQARLRAVSRRFPRTTGAALARLDLLHTEAITSADALDTERVDVAASAIDRREFEGYAWYRAGLILDEAGTYAQAYERMPPVEQLPQAWRTEAKREEQDIALRALAASALASAPAEVIAIYERHEDELAEHPERAQVLEIVAPAYADYGRFSAAAELLRQQLRLLPSSRKEAEIVDQLARAYGFLEDQERATEVIGFQLGNHPKAPHLLERIRAHILQTQRLSGLDTARLQLERWRKQTPRAMQRDLLEIEADLVLAHAEPKVQARVLAQLRDLGYADPAAREPYLALAYARSGRHSVAIGLLRRWIGKTQDPELRDELTYALAESELAVGRTRDAVALFRRIARTGTRWGQVARVRLRARSLRGVVAALEQRGRQP